MNEQTNEKAGDIELMRESAHILPTLYRIHIESDGKYQANQNPTNISICTYLQKVERKNLSESRIYITCIIVIYTHNSTSLPLSFGTKFFRTKQFFSFFYLGFDTAAAAACHYLKVEMCDTKSKQRSENNSERQGERYGERERERTKQPEDTSSETAIA